MVFINFMIAVISDSYNTITEFSDAHDYKQRISMIFERELYFTHSQVHDSKLFPKFLIIRKQKQNTGEVNSIMNQIKLIRQYIGEQSTQSMSLINEKSNEQKEHQNNSVKFLENEFSVLKKQQSNIEKQLKKQGKILMSIKNGKSVADFATTFNGDMSEIVGQKGKSVKLLNYASRAASQLKSQEDSLGDGTLASHTQEGHPSVHVSLPDFVMSKNEINHTEPTRNIDPFRIIASWNASNEKHISNILIRDDQKNSSGLSTSPVNANNRVLYQSITEEIIKEIDNPVVAEKVSILQSNYDNIQQENDYLKRYIIEVNTQNHIKDASQKLRSNRLKQRRPSKVDSKRQLHSPPTRSESFKLRSKTPNDSMKKKFDLSTQPRDQKLKNFPSNHPQIRQALEKRNFVRLKQGSQISQHSTPSQNLSYMSGPSQVHKYNEKLNFNEFTVDDLSRQHLSAMQQNEIRLTNQTNVSFKTPFNEQKLTSSFHNSKTNQSQIYKSQQSNQNKSQPSPTGQTNQMPFQIQILTQEEVISTESNQQN